MRAAIIEDNVVINIVEYDPNEDYVPVVGVMLPLTDTDLVKIGWVKDGSNWGPSKPTVEQTNVSSRTNKIQGAKDRARQISVLSQTASARGTTAWTQGQRVAILDAVGDLALMLSWLADEALNNTEVPD